VARQRWKYAIATRMTFAVADLDPSSATLVVGLSAGVDVQVDPAATAMATVPDRDPASLAVAYRSATANVMRVAIAYFPGWRATLDGVDLPVVVVDHTFLGVVVPAGDGEVRLVYVPRLFAPGAALSGAALLGTVIVLALSAQRASRDRSRTPSGGRSAASPPRNADAPAHSA
jgi:hypothetical protein